MKYSFSKIYVAILILWIPFYYLWGWIRFKFVGDPSAALGYAIEAFDIGLVLLINCSIFFVIKNKFQNLWDYIIFFSASAIFFITGGHNFLISYFLHN